MLQTNRKLTYIKFENMPVFTDYSSPALYEMIFIKPSHVVGGKGITQRQFKRRTQIAEKLV